MPYNLNRKACRSYYAYSLMALSAISVNSWAECEEDVTPVPGAPVLELNVTNLDVSASWSMSSGEVDEYVLYYAPYSNPISDVTLNNIQSIEMEDNLSINAQLPAGTELYVAVTGANCSGESAYSNIEVLRVSSDSTNTSGSNGTGSGGSGTDTETGGTDTGTDNGTDNETGTDEGTDNGTGTDNGNANADEPAAVTAMRDKAAQIAKNSQGYYEAKFSNGMVFIYIPGGTFTMGATQMTDAEIPTHQVTLSPYWIAKYQVTKGNFSSYVSATGYVTDAEKAGAEGCFIYDSEEKGFAPSPEGNWKNTLYTQADNHPVVCVSHNDATAYATWLASQLGVNIKLPSEAQWEFAARGTDQRLYPWGNTLPNGTLANYADITFANVYPGSSQGIPDLAVNDGYSATSPVGNYPAGASPFGALDMAGNASEWVADWFADYTTAAQTDPTGPSSGDSKVNRGGNWVDSAGRQGQTPSEIDDSHNILSAGRASDAPSSSDDHNGFRISIQ